MTKRIGELAAGTSSGYLGMRARVEAGATLRPALDLLRAMEELGGRLRGPSPREGETEERRLEREIEERRERLTEMRGSTNRRILRTPDTCSKANRNAR